MFYSFPDRKRKTENPPSTEDSFLSQLSSCGDTHGVQPQHRVHNNIHVVPVHPSEIPPSRTEKVIIGELSISRVNRDKSGTCLPTFPVNFWRSDLKSKDPSDEQLHKYAAILGPCGVSVRRLSPRPGKPLRLESPDQSDTPVIPVVPIIQLDDSLDFEPSDDEIKDTINEPKDLTSTPFNLLSNLELENISDESILDCEKDIFLNILPNHMKSDSVSGSKILKEKWFSGFQKSSNLQAKGTPCQMKEYQWIQILEVSH